MDGGMDGFVLRAIYTKRSVHGDMAALMAPQKRKDKTGIN